MTTPAWQQQPPRGPTSPSSLCPPCPLLHTRCAAPVSHTPPAVALEDAVLSAPFPPSVTTCCSISGGLHHVSTVRAGEQGSAAAWDEDERRFSSAAGGPPPADWCAPCAAHLTQSYDRWHGCTPVCLMTTTSPPAPAQAHAGGFLLACTVHGCLDMQGPRELCTR